jgi:hypothetical protein
VERLKKIQNPNEPKTIAESKRDFVETNEKKNRDSIRKTLSIFHEFLSSEQKALRIKERL